MCDIINCIVLWEKKILILVLEFRDIISVKRYSCVKFKWELSRKDYS